MDPAQLQEGDPTDANTTTNPRVEEDAAESPDNESGEGAGASQEDQGDEGEERDQSDEGDEGESEPEIEISIKGEEPPPPPSKADAAFARMRRENAELKRQLQSQGQPQPEKAVDLGPKPTLASCGFDEAAYEEKLDAWKEGQRKEATRKEAEAKQADETARFWKSRNEVYAQGRERLSKQIPQFGEAEEAVKAAIDKGRQNLILSVADNPALVVAALGQRPKLLDEFAKEADPFRFAAKLAKLEANLSTTKKQRSKVPPPEDKLRGSGAPSGSTIERARAEAHETRDFTNLLKVKRERREKTK